MKKISLLLFLVFAPALGWAGYVQVCPLGPGCDPAEMVWLEIDPFGATLNPEIVAAVVGGGLLLWGVGVGIGMFLQTVRKFR